MMQAMLRTLKRFLRSPRVIVGEVVAIALAGVLGAALPQVGTAPEAELAALRKAGPVVAGLIDVLALDHVFSSYWFLTIILLATASLSIVALQQLRRLRITWSKPLTEVRFKTAPYRTEFQRPARLSADESRTESAVVLRPGTRIGLIGSPVFHIGLLCLIVAGVLRALFAVDAVVDLIEGETLPPTASAWAAQWPGAMAKPFQVDQPVTLDAVHATRYETGALEELKLQLKLGDTAVGEHREISVNQGLDVSGGRLYMSQDFGPAAMIEWRRNGEPPIREAVLLDGKGNGRYEGTSSGPDGMRAHLRAELDNEGNHASALEVRVIGEDALLFANVLQVGDTASLPDGLVLELHGAPFWARVHGSRDRALWLAYAGFALMVAGSAIIFGVVKVDTCVVVTPAGEIERVFVALRAHRFAPLYHERFQRLVRQEGGSV